MQFTDNERRAFDDLQDDHFEDDEEVDFILDDMVLSRQQMDELFGSPGRRNAIVDPEQLWPNKTVPVFISDDFSKSRKTKDS